MPIVTTSTLATVPGLVPTATRAPLGTHAHSIIHSALIHVPASRVPSLTLRGRQLVRATGASGASTPPAPGSTQRNLTAHSGLHVRKRSADISTLPIGILWPTSRATVALEATPHSHPSLPHFRYQPPLCRLHQHRLHQSLLHQPREPQSIVLNRDHPPNKLASFLTFPSSR